MAYLVRDEPFIADCELRVDVIFDQYFNIISPYIVTLEVLTGEFPVEILNEIRAIFGHIGKMRLADSKESVESNVEKAESHTKRAILDCYKYLCLAYDDEYKKFDAKYKRIDLTDVDDGKFVPSLSNLRIEAVRKIQAAKMCEISSQSITGSYTAFEEAYLSYAAVASLIEHSAHGIERAQRKARKDRIIFWMFGFFTVIGAISGFMFWIVDFESAKELLIKNIGTVLSLLPLK